ncbi:hypothetical protein BS17DRAFT_93581 [Gyrodon lividus]|nr:hypothetical protein BS17DRAFT_93581 [Gyrodon lividus]
MFTLPQPNSQAAPPQAQSPTSPSVISVSESGTTLRALLLLCYPAAHPTFDSFGDAWVVIDAAVKYDMSTIMQRLKDLVAHCYLERSPLSFYALCCRFGWRELAGHAARQTLKIKTLGRPSLYVDEMEHIIAGAYHNLLAFHLACGVAAEGVRSSINGWIPSRFLQQFCTCGHPVLDHSSIQNYLIGSSRELLLRPDVSTLRSSESASFKGALRTMSGASESRCKGYLVDHIEYLRDCYVVQIEKVLSEVQLEFRS